MTRSKFGLEDERPMSAIGTKRTFTRRLIYVRYLPRTDMQRCKPRHNCDGFECDV